MNRIASTFARNMASFPPKGLTKPTIAIAGATGAVGKDMLEILAERNFPMSDLKLLASARSKGKKLEYAGKEYTVEELTEDSFKGVDIALFSAGGSQSKKFASAATNAGCVVVDNSSAFRMDADTPLVVPEVNGEEVKNCKKGIIANPNCSTIIMTVPVWPLHKAFGVKRCVVSTYQAASGAGAAAMAELEQQARDWVNGKSPVTQDIFGRQYIWNLFSHNSDIMETGYNEEEMKMINETSKIFGETVPVSVTCIRVPVLRAHCESINLTFEKKVTLEEVRSVLESAPGIKILDDRANNKFPEPLIASGQDDVIVGRLRYDLGQEEGYGIEMFVAGDQLRKGAATNAIQIAELLLEK